VLKATLNKNEKPLPLTDREKEQLKGMIDAGQPLPPRYKAVLFDQPHEAELIWPGKTAEVTNVVLPFQSIEQIDEPRAETSGQVADLFAFDASTGRQSGGWTGATTTSCSPRKNGPLRREIEAAGGLKLVYIDPPFDVGADVSFVADHLYLPSGQINRRPNYCGPLQLGD
jgi:adenine-specific DNA-methyltransferase